VSILQLIKSPSAGFKGDNHMNKQPEGGDGDQQPQPFQQQQACSACGQIATPLPVLDTRSGKNYRLFRCDPCQSLTWFEER